MIFIDSGYMDFEFPKAKVENYDFGNIIIPISRMIAFEFPADLQSETFVLQKMTYNNDTNEYTWADNTTLDVTHKKTGYFEAYDFSASIDEGIYRIKAGSYYSKSTIKAIDFTIEQITGIYLVDGSGNKLVDGSGNYLIQPI